jgi:hypothetical protein
MSIRRSEPKGSQGFVYLVAVAAAVAGIATPAFAFEISPFVIYGEDNRQDLYQVGDAELQRLADSTVALFKSSKISYSADRSTATLATQSFGTGMNLCMDEPYYDQKNGAFCSGSLVGKDLILTAGHCVTTQSECLGTAFVFGFGIRSRGQSPDQLPAGEVYGCKEIVGRMQVGSGADYAVIRLNRAVENHSPLEINRRGEAAVGTPLVVIGHPSGLPTKVAGGAQVRKTDLPGFFVANLDTYGGNSGSAVFNASTGLIEGVLVRGETDYVFRTGSSCRVSNRCTDAGCRGEDVTRISSVAALIPQI